MNIAELKTSFTETFGNKKFFLFSAPGRTEIAGNHTDHQCGKVITGAVTLECTAAACKNTLNKARIKSENYPYFEVDLNSLEINEAEKGSSASLIRGIVAGFADAGIISGGFDAYISSDVPVGSGLSSSAAFEVLICTVINHLYSDTPLSALDIAKISQTAESRYFGKPCGLLDQMASSLGGCNYIDFENPELPTVKPVDFSVDGYTLCVVNTGGNHSGLTGDYAGITLENASVCRFFGAKHLNEVNENEFFGKIPELLKENSERAVLRAIHFFEEQKRVGQIYSALKEKNAGLFLKLVNQSGVSSQNLLQNYYSASSPETQPITLAVELTKRFLSGEGAVRVHGGGFAGTIQCYIPDGVFADYKNYIEKIFGENSVTVLKIKQTGPEMLCL